MVKKQKSIDESSKPSTANEAEQKSVPDIFLWANQSDAHKESLQIDMFVFTKGYTVYALNNDKMLKAQMKVLFLYDMISQVQTGAATGMLVRDARLAGDEDNELNWAMLDSAEHAQEVIEQIAYGEESIEVWHNGDNDLAKVKGLVARFSYPDGEPFYIAKLLPKSNVMKASQAWELNNDLLMPARAEATLRVTPDNQVLFIGDRIFIFNLTKFTRLFGHDPQKSVELESKIGEIERHFNLRFPEGANLYTFALDNKKLIAKLLRSEPESVTQAQLIEQADAFGLALMVDDNDSTIIITDTKSATLFIDLLNDDYVGSSMTGSHYFATKKTELHDTDVKQTGMGL